MKKKDDGAKVKSEREGGREKYASEYTQSSSGSEIVIPLIHTVIDRNYYFYCFSSSSSSYN